MITCSRRIQFCAGHRVLGHESKCANMHGHNYVAWIHAVAPSLDQVGRVIDFSVLKEKIGGWIDRYWDHTFLVNQADHEVRAAIANVKTSNKFAYVCPFNPTAEEMARYLLTVICPRELAGTGVTVTRVEIYETENCMAEATL